MHAVLPSERRVRSSDHELNTGTAGARPSAHLFGHAAGTGREPWRTHCQGSSLVKAESVELST